MRTEDLDLYHLFPVRATASNDGCVALQLALLLDGISEAVKRTGPHPKRTDRLSKEAREWIFSDSVDAEKGFTFIDACELVGIPPSKVRTYVTKALAGETPFLDMRHLKSHIVHRQYTKMEEHRPRHRGDRRSGSPALD